MRRLIALSPLVVLVAVACFPDASRLRPQAGTGGAPGSSGAPGSAGMPGSGGVGGSTGPGTGGVSGTGGMRTGGTTGTGGSPAMGGSSGTGGSPGAGGMGGSPATGGAGGGTGGAGGMSMPMMTRAQSCTEYANAYAAKQYACAPFLTLLNYGSQTAHASRLQYACNLVDLPGVTFPPIPFKPCADGLAAQSCDDWADGVTPPGCTGVGQVPDGGTCGSGYQCASAFCSLPTSGCGRCARPPGVNDPCVEGSCPNGLICNGSSYCVVPGARGARCNADTPCRPSLGCRSGFCAVRSDVGATCMTLDDCNFPHGALCNTAIARCVQATIGNMCRVNPDYSVVACGASAFCRPDGGCLPAAADGAACNDQVGPSCLPPARCVDAHCRLYVPDKSCHP